MYGSRKFHKDKKLDLMLMEDSDPEDSEPEDVKAIKGEGEFRKVKRMPGMYYKVIIRFALSRENLSSRFPTKRVSNQSPQLQRLARKLKFHLQQVYIRYFTKSNNKDADQTARRRRLVWACVVRKPQKTGFLAWRPTCFTINSYKLLSYLD